jgi:hypothetical protein
MSTSTKTKAGKKAAAPLEVRRDWVQKLLGATPKLPEAKTAAKSCGCDRGGAERATAAEMVIAEDLPKGWDQSSAKKYWDSLTGDVEHKRTRCMKDLKGKVNNTGAFCNWAEQMAGGKQAAAQPRTAGDPISSQMIGGKKFYFQNGKPYVHPEKYLDPKNMGHKEMAGPKELKKKEQLQKEIEKEIEKLQKKTQQPQSGGGDSKDPGKTAGVKSAALRFPENREHWQVMPQDQGQIVEVSYAEDGEEGYLYRRVYDQHDRSEVIYRAKYNWDEPWADTPFEPWNGIVPEPPESAWKMVYTFKEEGPHQAATRTNNNGATPRPLTTRRSAVRTTTTTARANVPTLRVASTVLSRINREGAFVFQGWHYERMGDAEKEQSRTPDRPDAEDAPPFVEDTYDSRAGEKPPKMDDLDFPKGKKPSDKPPGAESAPPFVEDTYQSRSNEKPPTTARARHLQRRSLSAHR